MKKWKITGLGVLASIAFLPSLWAQVPAPAVPAGAPAAAAAPTKNLWSFLLPSSEQCAKCKDHLCNGPLGDVLKGIAKPVSLATGGLIGGKCGVPTAEDLAKLKAAGQEDSAEGAAAAIKKNEAEAQKRREAVRYLGTVDCNYWPEAIVALKTALRSDPSECVRFEAALALGRGCCCKKEIMEALKHSANGDDKDGAPAENSDRVRAAAHNALEHCTAEYTEPAETIPEKKKLKEVPKEVPKTVPTTINSQAGMRDSPRGKGVLGIFVAAASPAQAVAAPAAAQAAAAHAAPQIPDQAPVQAAVPEKVVQTAAEMPPKPVPQPAQARPQTKRGLLQIIGASFQSPKVQTHRPTVPPAGQNNEVKPAAEVSTTLPPLGPPQSQTPEALPRLQGPDNR